jgi:hypothetical protein
MIARLFHIPTDASGENAMGTSSIIASEDPMVEVPMAFSPEASVGI